MEFVEKGLLPMANDCANRLVVKGPSADVLAFVASAYGRYDPDWGLALKTEEGVVRAVQAGREFEEAIEDANLRIARLRSEHLASDADGFKPISSSACKDFNQWARWACFELPDRSPPRMSHLSLPSLVPVPPEVLAESYDLIGNAWVMERWGVKWGVGSEAPSVTEVEGNSVATYASFDSANGPPLKALLTASESWKSLSFALACHFSDEDEVLGVTFVDGRVLSRLRLPDTDFPATREPLGEDTFHYRPEPLLSAMVDRTIRQAA